MRRRFQNEIDTFLFQIRRKYHFRIMGNFSQFNCLCATQHAANGVQVCRCCECTSNSRLLPQSLCHKNPGHSLTIRNYMSAYNLVYGTKKRRREDFTERLARARRARWSQSSSSLSQSNKEDAEPSKTHENSSVSIRPEDQPDVLVPQHFPAHKVRSREIP